MTTQYANKGSQQFIVGPSVYSLASVFWVLYVAFGAHGMIGRAGSDPVLFALIAVATASVAFLPLFVLLRSEAFLVSVANDTIRLLYLSGRTVIIRPRSISSVRLDAKSLIIELESGETVRVSKARSKFAALRTYIERRLGEGEGDVADDSGESGTERGPYDT